MLKNVEMKSRKQASHYRTVSSIDRSINCSINCSIRISGEEYKLLLVHFYSPGEHDVKDKPYAMEVYYVRANSAGKLAVVGVFLTFFLTYF